MADYQVFDVAHQAVGVHNLRLDGRQGMTGSAREWLYGVPPLLNHLSVTPPFFRVMVPKVLRYLLKIGMVD